MEASRYPLCPRLCPLCLWPCHHGSGSSTPPSDVGYQLMGSRGPCLIPWKNCKHDLELGKTLLALIYVRLWESASGSIKGVHLWFPVVTHEDIAFFDHVDAGPFPSDFVFSSILDPFLRSDEELGHSGRVVELFEIKVVNLTRVILQVQYNGAYPLGLT